MDIEKLIEDAMTLWNGMQEDDDPEVEEEAASDEEQDQPEGEGETTEEPAEETEESAPEADAVDEREQDELPEPPELPAEDTDDIPEDNAETVTEEDEPISEPESMDYPDDPLTGMLEERPNEESTLELDDNRDDSDEPALSTAGQADTATEELLEIPEIGEPQPDDEWTPQRNRGRNRGVTETWLPDLHDMVSGEMRGLKDKVMGTLGDEISQQTYFLDLMRED